MMLKLVSRTTREVKEQAKEKEDNIMKRKSKETIEVDEEVVVEAREVVDKEEEVVVEETKKII